MSETRDALEAAHRRNSDEELTVARLIGYAYHAIPDDVGVEEARAVAKDVLREEDGIVVVEHGATALGRSGGEV